MKFKNKRQRIIYEALIGLGGKARLWDIAEKACLNTNGVSQTLGVMYGIRPCLPFYNGGLQEWEIYPPINNTEGVK